MARFGRLKVAWKISDAWWLDDFFALVAEGKQRIGESSFINQGMAEAHGKWEVINGRTVCVKVNYEAVKQTQ